MNGKKGRYYTPRELAGRLGISYKTVLRRIAAGRIKAERIGHEYLIHEGDIDAISPRPV